MVKNCALNLNYRHQIKIVLIVIYTAKYAPQ